MSKDPITGPAVAEGDTRFAPDPLCIVLPALAALGAVASIAAMNWVAQDRTAARARTKRRVDVALRELESCCLGLGEIFRRLTRQPHLIAPDSRTAASALKFGALGRRVDATGARTFHQLTNDVASMLVLASQSSFDVMSAIEDGEIDAPEAVFFGFAEQQERLTGLLQNRSPVVMLVDAGQSIAEALVRHVRGLKQHKVAAP